MSAVGSSPSVERMNESRELQLNDLRGKLEKIMTILNSIIPPSVEYRIEEDGSIKYEGQEPKLNSITTRLLQVQEEELKRILPQIKELERFEHK